MTKRIVLADPRGFCAGVDRAILTVQTILDQAGAAEQRSADSLESSTGLPPVYVRKQIVHNRHVVESLKNQGAVFVNSLDEIPDEAAAAGIPIVFSAHGVSPAVQDEAKRRGFQIVDATCPLVGKVHREVLRFVKDGYEVVYIGHKGHDEAVGVIGEAPNHVHLIEHEDDVESLNFDPDTKLILLSQTTLSVDETAGTIAALQKRFPWIELPPNSDICYATSNRQAAVKAVAEVSDCMIIVGSANSSNTVRLMEVADEALSARGLNNRAYRVDDADELSADWFLPNTASAETNAEASINAVGISSGASVPESLVSGVIDRLKEWGFTEVESVETTKETMHFVLPPALRKFRSTRQ